MATKGEQTKQRILETAATLFWKHSYHGIRVDQIVAEAGVNKASFYQYFKSKEQIAEVGIQYMYESTLSYVFEGSFREFSHPIDRLESIFKKIYTTHLRIKKTDGRCPGCPFVNMGNELATDNEDIRKTVVKIFESFHEYHRKIYADAAAKGLAQAEWDEAVVGRQIQGVVNGAMTSSKIRNRPKDILDGMDTVKRLLGMAI